MDLACITAAAVRHSIGRKEGMCVCGLVCGLVHDCVCMHVCVHAYMIACVCSSPVLQLLVQFVVEVSCIYLFVGVSPEIT